MINSRSPIANSVIILAKCDGGFTLIAATMVTGHLTRTRHRPAVQFTGHLAVAFHKPLSAWAPQELPSTRRASQSFL
ncbi:Hypothetical protein NTJ_07062 [Nesidiocoris tenuis]|uniref:Uncharacterized protein n=1 Tax=Nesidiocoris tenuis TaxID=355587 RepID=A0ABN7AQL6_9HEMI|nr:Hypothetical protein NTJ_07062 [Nesidiocoris tenuis]